MSDYQTKNLVDLLMEMSRNFKGSAMGEAKAEAFAGRLAELKYSYREVNDAFKSLLFKSDFFPTWDQLRAELPRKDGQSDKCPMCKGDKLISAILVNPRPASYFKGEKDPDGLANWDKQQLGEKNRIPPFNFRCHCSRYPEYVPQWSQREAKYFQRI